MSLPTSTLLGSKITVGPPLGSVTVWVPLIVTGFPSTTITTGPLELAGSGSGRSLKLG